MGIIDNANYVKSASYFPCARPEPILIIEAAASALGPVLLSFAAFGCNDIVKMRAGLSPWHRRAVKAMLEGAIPPEQRDMVNKVYKFAIPVEKLLFVWFVADLTVEFFARFHSQLFKLGACGQAADVKTATGNYLSFVSPSRIHWARIAYSLTYPQGPFGSDTDFFVPAHWYYNAFFSLNVKAIHPGETVRSMQIRLRRLTGDGAAYYSPKFGAPWFGNNVQGSLKHDDVDTQDVFRGYVFEAITDVDAVGVGGSCAIQISNRPLVNEGIIPMNCFGGPAPSDQFGI